MTTRDDELARDVRVAVRLAWVDAERYVRGSRVERARIRQRLAKSSERLTSARLAYQRMLLDRLEAFAIAIIENRLPRTIRPSKLFYLVNGHGY